MVETWRPVVGYEGHYEVSDEGRVRSLDRPATRVVNGKSFTRTLLGRDLAQTPDVYGYLSATLTRGGVHRLVKIHKLVLTAFVGDRPEGTEACHNNGNSTDNRLENLRWDTHANNNHDRISHGTAPWINLTHCKHGHPYDAANTHIDRKGGRRCRTCNRERMRKAAA